MLIMDKNNDEQLPVYRHSIAGSLLAAREAVMAPIRPHLRSAGITEQQWRVLRVLNDDGVLEAGAVARNALLYAPSVTRIVKDLQHRGLVARHADPKDARKSQISITVEGKRFVQETATQTRKLLDLYDEAFGSERLNAFRKEALELAACLQRFAPEV
jgi:homoprotocatechuate degradation regulator HpaR